MPLQFDYISGLDISSLSSVTQAQLMQMINQIAPLSNIGGVIFQAATGVQGQITQGTNGSPSVTDNPRFARYIWLNTHHAATAAPTPYYYNANSQHWVSTTVANESISNNQIAPDAAIAVTKLAAGPIYNVLRSNSAGLAVEYTTPANIFSPNELPVSKLTSNGATNAYLKTTGSVTQWVSESAERTAIISSINNLPVIKLQSSTPNTILYTNGNFQTAWGLPSDVFANTANIPLNGLSANGTNPNDIIAYNNSAWAPVKQSLLIGTTADISTIGKIPEYASDGTSPLTNGLFSGTSFSVVHGLGAVPKLIRVVIRCIAGDTNSDYAQNDEIEHTAFVGPVATGASILTIYADNQKIYGVKKDATTPATTFVQKKGTPNAVRVAVSALTNFQYKVYAWA